MDAPSASDPWSVYVVYKFWHDDVMPGGSQIIGLYRTRGDAIEAAANHIISRSAPGSIDRGAFVDTLGACGAATAGGVIVVIDEVGMDMFYNVDIPAAVLISSGKDPDFDKEFEGPFAEVFKDECAAADRVEEEVMNFLRPDRPGWDGEHRKLCAERRRNELLENGETSLSLDGGKVAIWSLYRCNLHLGAGNAGCGKCEELK